MPSRESNVNYSRSVRHANMMNKRGCGYVYNKPVNSNKSPMKVKKVCKSPKAKVVYESSGDIVIEGKPPKVVIKMENRFTIPDVPENQNIAHLYYLRSHIAKGLLNQDLKTQFKVRSFNEDNMHEIEIL